MKILFREPIVAFYKLHTPANSCHISYFLQLLQENACSFIYVDMLHNKQYNNPMNNQFQRTESILGAESTARLKECRVAVFGAGGVGGYVIEALARSGVGTLDIIDADTVDITNLNRQIIATHDSIGHSKVDVFEERIHSINPDAVVIKNKGLYLPLSSIAKEHSKDKKLMTKDAGESCKDESLSRALMGTQKSNSADQPVILTENDFDFSAYSYIVDAIDTVSSKIDLVRIAKERGIPIISAMGCGNRIDPSRLKLTDIFKTQGDPLARVMRKRLRELGIRKLKVVCSEEEPIKPGRAGLSVSDSVHLAEPDSAHVAEHDNTTSKNKRAPGSTPFVPAAAGLLIASVVVRDLLTDPFVKY